jgi:hypothetical protein
MGYASGFTIWRREDFDPKKIRAEEEGTPPSGQPIIPFPTGRNLFFVANGRGISTDRLRQDRTNGTAQNRRGWI